MTQDPPTVFPTVTGSNLNRREYSLPRDFEADLNIVFLAFFQAQQSEVDSWLPWAISLEQRSGVRVYELPTLTRGNGLFRAFIDGGMRAGIPDPAARARTITLYLDRPGFLRDLGVASDDTITTLLLRRSGEVLWRATGPYSDSGARALEAALTAAQAYSSSR